MNNPNARILLSAGMIQGGRSGVGRYVIEIAGRLSRRPAIDLSVCGLDSDRHLFGGVDDAHWISIPAAFAKGPLNLLWHQCFLPGLLKSKAFHLLHIPSYRRLVAASPVPQVATIHDCAPFRLRDKYDALRGFFGRQIVPRLARRCDHVIAVSGFTSGDLLNFMKLAPERLTTVQNGIDHGAFRPIPDAERKAFREQKRLEAPFFLYIARLEHPGKNHVRLVEAFERFRRAHPDSRHELVLGGSDWHGADVIRKRVAESPLREAIRLEGFMADVEMPLWYATAQALVFPSLFEGFGLPVIEAMACRTLVACSNTASLPEVGGSAALYFDPLSTDAIAEALGRIAWLDEASREAALERGRAHALRYDWERATDETLAVYQKVLGKT